jgi:hypothetical protein
VRIEPGQSPVMIAQRRIRAPLRALLAQERGDMK